MLLQEQQENADRVFTAADAVVMTESVPEIKKVLKNLEGVAGQLTSAMMNPTADTTSSEV